MATLCSPPLLQAGPGAGAGRQWVKATHASPRSSAALLEPCHVLVIPQPVCLLARAKSPPCLGPLWLFAGTPAAGRGAGARSMPPGPAAWVPWPSGAGPPRRVPSKSVSANNLLLTALFYYFTAQFFLEFYGISLKPPEGDTAPFPEVK